MGAGTKSKALHALKGELRGHRAENKGNVLTGTALNEGKKGKKSDGPVAGNERDRELSRLRLLRLAFRMKRGERGRGKRYALRSRRCNFAAA